MNGQGGMDGPGFLDPIPEDVSVVAASQHATNLSTVSAVASSDSGAMAEPTASKKKRIRRIRTDQQRMLGTTEEVEDTLSDANASLGGANEGGLEMPFAIPTKEGDVTKKSLWSPNCKKWSLIVTILAAMVGIGMFVILHRLPPATGDPEASPFTVGVTLSPTPIPTFSPFTVSYSTNAPTVPTYSSEEVKILDDIFLNVPGTNARNIVDLTTAEGKAREWMINSDKAININEEQRIQQRYVLCVLYFATNGNFWTKKTNWLDPGRSECDWHGIACNNGNSAMRSISLGENNVTGTLPNEVVSLPNLLSFNMSHNDISGTIPENMFDLLEQLDTLDLEKNKIAGTIPGRTRTTSNSALRTINLGSNQLTGTLPFFESIVTVSFEKNNLTSVDARYSTSAPSLKKFRGFHNELSGPLPTVWNLPNLVELDLGYNFLTGTIPLDLWNLPSLKTLWLDHCNLTGPLPDSSESSSMHRLWLDSNSLSGTIPLNFGWNWTKLYSVKLQENLLTGSISMRQCDRWKVLGPNDVSISVAEAFGSELQKDRTSMWTFDVDCQIDCACCTNTECGRR